MVRERVSRHLRRLAGGSYPLRVAASPPANRLVASLTAALHAVLARQSGIRLALLFGSQATGHARGDSDVDIGYLGHCSDRTRLAMELGDACGRSIDLVSLERAGVPLLDELVRDGKILYESAPGAYGRWLSHALSSLELDRAWYARMRDAWLESVATRGV